MRPQMRLAIVGSISLLASRSNEEGMGHWPQRHTGAIEKRR